MNYLQRIYYSSSWKSLTYLCWRACSVVNLFLGLNNNKCLSKSKAYSEAPGTKASNDFFFGMLVLEMMFAASGDSIDSISFCDGLPINSKILSIWFKVEFPGKVDLPMINYPNMQPTDHMSTAFEYLVDPSRIYGARYHLVATYSVKLGSPTSFGQFSERARPKSATLAWHSEFKSKLLGFRSRWINSPECMYLSALRSW